jgi:predicted TIM-barrel fold metal-dependent hydrolase
VAVIHARVEAFDIDVTFGPWPRLTEGTDLDSVRRLLAGERITGAALCAATAARHDAYLGNEETLAACAGEPALVPAGVIDLRDAAAAAGELDRLAAVGVRLLRLFPPEHDAGPDSPALTSVLRAAGSRFVIATSGDVRSYWRPFAEVDAPVVFLDTHFYHLSDFLILARQHHRFHSSTRLLNSPDAYERVAGEVGADRLLFGSGAPRFEPAVPALRLAASPLDPHEKERIARTNAWQLLEEVG